MKPVRLLSRLAILGAIALLANCPNPVLDQINAKVAAANSGVSPFATYSFTKALNSGAGVSLDVTGTIKDSSVDITVPFGTDVTKLIATFTTSQNGSLTVAALAQTSGTTVNDFSSPVTYTLTLSDGSSYTGTVTVHVAAAGVFLNKTTLSMSAGGSSFMLQAQVTPADPVATLVWTTSDASIVKISDFGGVPGYQIVLPVAAGTATVTASTADGSKSASCVITVAPAVAVTGITMSSSALNIPLGGAPYHLTTTITPSNATNTFVNWTSSTPGTATVDSSGYVTAVGLGYSIITATTFDGGKTATCLINVVPATPVSGISLNQATASIAVGGGTVYLTATITPANATNQSVTWTTSDASHATVTNYGGTYAYVTPVAAGSATITAKTADGNFTATCVVTVTAPVAVTGITVSQSSWTLNAGQSGYLYSYIAPSNATNQNATWSSSDPSVVSISYSYSGYASFNALKQGSATITVTTADGNFTASSTINVGAAIGVYSVTVSPSSINLAIGTTYGLGVTVMPDNATNKNLTWTTSNASLATVDTNGVVTALGSSGSVTITAKATDGSNKQGTATVTLTPPVAISGMTWNQGTVTLPQGSGYYIYTSYYTISPSNATNQNLTWSSSNANYVTVTYSSGYVYLFRIAAGSVTITANSTDGSLKSFSFTVN